MDVEIVPAVARERQPHPARASVRALIAIAAGLLCSSLLVTPVGTAAAGAPCPTQAPPSTAPTPMAEPERMALFDAVWTAIDTKHVDPAHNGVDWAAVRTEYEPRVAAASTDADMDALLTEMVGLLGRGEAEYLVPTAEVAEEGTAGIGFFTDREPTDDRSGMRVVYVMPDSPAARAGLRDRDLILAVDGDTCPRRSIVRGEPGTSVDLLVQAPGGELRTMTVTREVIQPTVLARARMLRENGEDRIGYVRMADLDGADAAHQVVVAIRGLLADGPLCGLVLDLRATGGVNGSAVNGIAAQFVSGAVTRSTGRDGSTDLVLPKGELLPRLTDTRLAVLIDERTSGTAEILAGILHGTRALTVGARSAGAATTMEVIELPAGRMLNVVPWREVLMDGSPITPVWPDIEVAGDWLTEPESADSGIAAALEAFGGYSSDAAPPDFLLIPLACNGHACPERTASPW